MKKNAKINVKGTEISVSQNNEMDYISLTDIAKSKDADSRAADIIKNRIRNRGTIEFIGTWEVLHNPDFKVVEFDHFRMNAGLTSFVLSPGKCVEKTNAIGIFVKSGRYGGTYAHKDIAFEFCSAISPVFELYLIKEFQRLKETERTFVKELDTAEEAVVYAKLSKGFSFPPPVGNYNPDWAVSFKEGVVKHVYFVAETKGSMPSMELREIEKTRIECARKFFDEINRKINPKNVKYDVDNSCGKLMEIVGVKTNSTAVEAQ